MSQQRQNKMVAANNAAHVGDTSRTKIFVGGLAWQTQRDSLQRYFEQFGEIQEAVVILDKNSGRSKGYGFVTFKDPDSAMRACENRYPLIDGRRANCNLAALGAQKNYPSTTPQRGMEKFRSSFRTMAPVPYQGTTTPTYFHQQVPHYAFPHSAYPYYPQDMFPMNYYNAYGGGGQQLPSYYAFVAAGSPGAYNYYPFHAQYGHDTPLQIPKTTQHPYLPPTSSVSPSTTAATAGVPGTGTGPASEQNSSA
ncbi:hypothetical protein FH972_016171 [Carpinus fangiana]|uniref:RRM domain-containing protein n=1 Tax=Carpinus fangiana TaxID=176857 RepID=A0A5N6RFC1_9ROSI|nr:hypothetical protein FH972_016171 [Carpinus fangiana]